MNKENTNKLVMSFPKIFPNGFYFECGDGWFDLIYKLCENINAECKKLGVSDDYWTTASQIKEKYGAMSFLVHLGHGSVFDLIEEAEEQSETICEDCGKPGERRSSGWIRITCNPCEATRNNKEQQ